MCTSIAFKTKDFYFGRNMDLEYNFGEKIVITPRNYLIRFKKTTNIHSHYAIIGTASIINNYPLYAEATNEKGLCIAGLNFPDNAQYNKQIDPKKYNISPFELILWILSQCENIYQAKTLLEKTNITDIPFSKDIPTSTLHWHIADINHSITVENTSTGMHIYNNPANVLTNNPPFNFHLTNLAQYLNLESSTPNNCFSEDIGIKTFCNGLGSVGLPGDYSSTSRFIKTAYLLLNSNCQNDENSSISQFFHILNSVEVVNGSINLKNNKDYFTRYTCCINANKGIFYYKSYENNQISAINMYNENIDDFNLISFPIIQKQQILWVN